MSKDLTWGELALRTHLQDSGAVRELLHVKGLDSVFVGTFNGDLVSVCSASGKEKMKIDLGGKRVGSLLHVAGMDRIFAGLWNGELVSVDMNGESAVVKSRTHGLVRRAMSRSSEMSPSTRVMFVGRRSPPPAPPTAATSSAAGSYT